MVSAALMIKTAGIVLAGGRSSRMGTNKALLPYKNVPLVEHMGNLLRQAGLTDVYISGDVPGYDCINDAVLHDGPAQAMRNLLGYFESDYERLLFVPVDMPLMQVKVLIDLVVHVGSAYYEGCPLPACLSTGKDTGDCRSVKDLLVVKKACCMDLPAAYKMSMSNINTLQDWKVLVS